MRGQLLVSLSDASGSALDGTGVQLQGVLDDALAYDGPLGDHAAPGQPGQHAVTGGWVQRCSGSLLPALPLKTRLAPDACMHA